MKQARKLQDAQAFETLPSDLLTYLLTDKGKVMTTGHVQWTITLDTERMASN